MSVKGKIIIPAVALTLLCGGEVAGTLSANAATSACTSCTNLYNKYYGPGDVLAALNQIAEAGQPLYLETASGTDEGEDFELLYQGMVSDLVSAGLMNPELGAYYSILGVYEIEWAPGGQPSGFCAGVQGSPGPRVPVTLQECGAAVNTFWIFDPIGSYDVLINGATDHDFRRPFVLTAKIDKGLETFQLTGGLLSEAQQWA